VLRWAKEVLALGRRRWSERAVSIIGGRREGVAQTDERFQRRLGPADPGVAPAGAQALREPPGPPFSAWWPRPGDPQSGEKPVGRAPDLNDVTGRSHR